MRRNLILKTEDKWLFIGDDARMALCSEHFLKKGVNSQHFAHSLGGEKLEHKIIEFSPSHLVFPVHQIQGSIRTELLAKDTTLITGKADAIWLEPFLTAGIRVESYLNEERFIWRNAVLTAEAFVHEYYERTKKSIANKHFYVAGFGRVGKMVAYTLQQLGGRVTVLARAASQLGEAEAFGYEVEKITSTFVFKEGSLVNTIPSKWLAVESHPKLHIFDLASSPGCLRAPLSSEYYTVLLALPGKHFPVDAASALADALERM